MSSVDPLDPNDSSLTVSRAPSDVGPEGTTGHDPVPVEPEARTVIRGGSSRAQTAPALPSADRTPAGVSKVLLGSHLNHFRLDKLIGGGGMGAVFRAHDQQLDRTVAIKVIPFVGEDPDLNRRFRNEAQSAAKLDHPNIARVFDVGSFENWHYIVFEYVEGTNIRDRVLRDGPLTIDEAVFSTCQLADAIGHAAGRGIVHRDIKPSNVVINLDDQIKLVDMGLARSESVELSEDMTASGVTLGTFDYISPEQALDPRKADICSDIYSLGCTFYFMLTGEPPYPGGTMLQKLMSHGNAPPPDPKLLRSEISDDLTAVVRRLLAKSPKDRYQTVKDLILDLQELATREGLVRTLSLSAASSSGERSNVRAWERYLPWALAATLLIGGAIGMQAVSSWTGNDRISVQLGGVPIVDQLDRLQDDEASSAGGSSSDLRLEVAGSPVAGGDAGSSSAPQSTDELGPRVFDGADTPFLDVAEIGTPATSAADPRPNLPPGETVQAAQGTGTLGTGSLGTGSLGTGSQGTGSLATGDFGPGFPAGVPTETLPLGSGAGAAVAMGGASPTFRNPSLPPGASQPSTAATADPTFEASGVNVPGRDASPVPFEVAAPIKVQVVDRFSLPDRVPSLGDLAMLQGASLDGVAYVRTLEEAIAICEAEACDQIELATPQIVSGPIRITRENLEIFSGVGRTRVEFQTPELLSMERARLVSVNTDRVAFRDLDFVWDATASQPNGGCLFALTENREFRMSNCTVTVQNPTERGEVWAFDIVTDPESVARDFAEPNSTDFDLNRDSREMYEALSSIGANQLPLVAMELENVIIRGEMTMVHLDYAVELQLKWTNGLLAISDRMIDTEGAMEDIGITAPSMQVELSRLTASIPKGLFRMRIGSTGRYPVALNRQAERCVFLVDPGVPQISVTGLRESKPIRSLVQIRGTSNAYPYPSADLQDPLLMIDDRLGGEEIVLLESLVSDDPEWSREESPKWSVRWSVDPLSDAPPSELTPADFRQDGSISVGFDEQLLPRILRPGEDFGMGIDFD